MTTKSTTVKKEVVKAVKVAAPVRQKIVNESRLVLPQDIGGFTSNFRREAARSVGRIMSDRKKLDTFLELLSLFGQYAEDRYEQSVIERDSAIAAKASKLVEAQATALRNADAVIKGKRAHAEQLIAEVAAHDAKMEASK